MTKHERDFRKHAPHRLSSVLAVLVLVGIVLAGMAALWNRGVHEAPLQHETDSAFAGETDEGGATASAPLVNKSSASTVAPVVIAPTASDSSQVLSPLAQEWRSATSRLKALEDCQESLECDFPQDSPASYSYAVDEAMAQELRHFSDIAQKWKDRGGQMPTEAQAVARHFLTSPSDEVKEAAIELLAVAPPNSENMRAVIDGLRESVSGPLYQTGLEELSRYARGEESSEISAFLLETMKQGGHYAAEEVARATLPFINTTNFKQYLGALAEMSPRSSTYLHLKLNLEEYARMQRGG
jgi:hypothetical protein